MNTARVRFRTAAIAALVLALAACTSVVEIKNDLSEPPNLSDDSIRACVPSNSDDTKETLPGLPFYRQVLRTTQVTTYQETVYRIHLMLQKNGSTSSGPSMLDVEVRQAVYEEDHPALRAAVEAAGRFPDGLTDKALARIVAGPLEKLQSDAVDPRKAFKIELPANTANLVMVSNQVTQDTMRDCRVHYLNKRAPLLGTASIDAHLGADGTLSEVSASRESKTADTLLGLLPISPLLSKSLSLTTDPKSSSAPSAADSVANILRGFEPSKNANRPEKYTLTLEVTSRGWVHEYRESFVQGTDNARTPLSPGCAVGSSPKCHYARKEIGAPSSDTKPSDSTGKKKSPSDGDGGDG